MQRKKCHLKWIRCHFSPDTICNMYIFVCFFCQCWLSAQLPEFPLSVSLSVCIKRYWCCNRFLCAKCTHTHTIFLFSIHSPPVVWWDGNSCQTKMFKGSIAFNSNRENRPLKQVKMLKHRHKGSPGFNYILFNSLLIDSHFRCGKFRKNSIRRYRKKWR